MKKNDLLIVIVFLAFLFIPNICAWIFQDSLDNTNYENRKLYEMPKLTFENIQSFPKNFENYFNDHVAYKNEIRRFKAKFDYNVFKIGTNQKVVFGENGWLFYNSISGEKVDSMLDYRNVTRYTNEEKKNVKETLEKAENKLNNKNIDFYVLVAPNKENVYSDYLDDVVLKSSNQYSKTEDLVNYLKNNTDLDIIYPKEQLVNNRKTADTYYKYDTHWNDYGAYLGVLELMRVIDENFNMPNISLVYKNTSGDLANMNLMGDTFINSEPTVDGFYNNIEYYCEDGVEFKSCTSSAPIYDKSLLFVGDSFRIATVQYLAKLYKNSIFVQNDYASTSAIEIYSPDVVIYEAVERYSNVFFNVRFIQ